MIKPLFSAMLLHVLTTSYAAAQQYVVNVHGIVCELCSYGVAKNVRKLPFIDSAQFDKGVKVDIENQMVFFAVNPDQSPDQNLDEAALFQAVFKAIEKGGYKPVKVYRIDSDGNRTEVEQ